MKSQAMSLALATMMALGAGMPVVSPEVHDWRNRTSGQYSGQVVRNTSQEEARRRRQADRKAAKASRGAEPVIETDTQDQEEATT